MGGPVRSAAVCSTQATVLDEDPDLADRVPRDRLWQARALSCAGVLELQAGAWQPAAEQVPAGGYGLLVLDGLIVRRVAVEGRVGAEVLGPGDVLRPWESDDAATTLDIEATWRVLAPTRMAVLDRVWTTRMASFPEIGSELVRRTLERFERMLAAIAIGGQRRLEVRLWLLLWQLAERYGRVRPDGVHVDLRLTHELLGQLTGAQRPSVSTALRRLEADGRIRRVERGLTLTHGASTPG